MMKLFVNKPSPYGRKVLVAAHECGLTARLAVEQVDPWTDPEPLLAVTPVGKVPALVLDDGSVLVESTAICESLDAAGPRAGAMHSTLPEVKARVGIAQGLIDAAFATVIERRRPEQLQWQDWIDRQMRVILRTLNQLPQPHMGRFDLGAITVACGLAYLDFRLQEIDWRSSRPDLSAWYETVQERASMQATRP